MPKRDIATTGYLDLGLKALLIDTECGDSVKHTQTDVTIGSKDTFSDMARAGRWPELITATENMLSSSGENFDARVWWIRAHLQAQSLPVSLLLPPFASLCEQVDQRNEISELASDLGELAQAMRERMLSAGDSERLCELQGLAKRYGIFASDREMARKGSGESDAAIEKRESPSNSRPLRGKSNVLEQPRPWKVILGIILLILGTAAVSIEYRGRRSVSRLDTRAVSDRIVEHTIFASGLALPTPSKRVELSNLDVLRYGMRGNVPVASQSISESTHPQLGTLPVLMTHGSEEVSRLNSTQDEKKKEKINVSGPVEGNEFRDGVDRERGIRPQLPHLEGYNRTLDGGVMHAPFETRRVVVVSPSRVFKRSSTSSAVLGQLLSGDKIVVEGVFGKWARIRSRKGQVGFVPVEALGEGMDFRAPE